MAVYSVISPTDDWLSVNNLLGIPVGTSIILQNSSIYPTIFQRSSSKPEQSSTSGRVLYKNWANIYTILSGSDEVWIKSIGNFKGGIIIEDETLYVARLDGLTQYWQLSEPIIILPNDSIELSFIGGIVDNGLAAFVVTTNFAVRFDVDSTASYLRENGLSATLNGVDVDSGVTTVPSSGSNEVALSVTSSGSLEQIASVEGSRLMNLPVYSFKVIRGGTVIHEIPLTNKAQGATQLPTVGSVSATMINYTEAVWQEL